MKKILSLTLAALMVVSMIPTAFAADVDYQNGTEVEYTGTRSTVEDDGSVTHNAEYTITVPALLAPGGSGTVTLEGYWPSDATVKVTAEEKVEMVNNINSADKKELAVTFASIEKAGSNTAIVTASAPVSVANIENALFGKWAGKFNYNVDYVAGSGNTGDSGTTEPSDPDDDATVAKFSIGGEEYEYEEGMTWAEWIESSYNTGDFSVYGGLKVAKNDVLVQYWLTNEYFDVSKSAVISSETQYRLTPTANLITFTIDGTEYQAVEGMTWEQWVNSDYNTIGLKVHDTGLSKLIQNDEGKSVRVGYDYMYDYTVITAGTSYIFN